MSALIRNCSFILFKPFLNLDHLFGSVHKFFDPFYKKITPSSGTYALFYTNFISSSASGGRLFDPGRLLFFMKSDTLVDYSTLFLYSEPESMNFLRTTVR